MAKPASGVIPAGDSSGDPPAGKDAEKLPTPRPVTGDTVGARPTTPVPTELTLPDLITMTVERNPRLAQVGWAVETARGRAIQGGLYPNPTFSVTGEDLGDRTGPGGIWGVPSSARRSSPATSWP